jgi:two-component system chemotaxis response regulator CheB
VVHGAEESRRPGLANLFARTAKLACDFAVESRHIYIAPPGKHTTLGDKRMRVVDGPRENGFRPAIDPLFRTAAFHHDGAVVGVILSGTRDDGAAGLAVITHHHGRAIVQAPGDCTFPNMPEAALALVKGAEVAPTRQLAARIVARVRGATPTHEAADVAKELERSKMGNNEGDPRVRSWDAFACPDCGGVLRALDESPMDRFQCRTGHAYSIESLLASQAEGVEAALWSAVNVLLEREDMSRRLADHSTRKGLSFAARRYLREAEHSAEQASKIIDVLKMTTNPLSLDREIEAQKDEE